MHGAVTDYITGKAIEDAGLDVWETAPSGLYERQDAGQEDYNLRRRFRTGRDGRYINCYCLRPTRHRWAIGKVDKVAGSPSVEAGAYTSQCQCEWIAKYRYIDL